MHVLLLESDRIMARLITSELEDRNVSVAHAVKAEDATKLADERKPDAIITELSIAGHSGTEFIYELRTYSDWQNIPLYVYSSLRLSEELQATVDWRLLDITGYYYKPDTDVRILLDELCAAHDMS